MDEPRAARPGDVARAALRGVAGSAPGIEATDERPQSDVPYEPTAPRTPRPGDAARAALRRRMASASGGVTDPGEARPGDAVRAALRRPTDPVSADGHSDDSVPSTSRSMDPAAETGDGVRPGDLAREALRAARAQARSGEVSVPRVGRTPAERAVDAVARAGAGDVSRERARAVRQVLAGAFRMPSDASEPEHLPEPEPDVESGVAAHVPRSMAAPARDGDHRRTFAAFAPRPAASRFAETWWGNAWVAALEEGALDAKRLARGRSYAEQGSVDAITVTPGLVLAYVRGSRPRPYRVQVRLRTFGAEDWERFLDAAVERPAHIAALLDKEMPESLAECGVPLLPGPGDLDPHCTCPDRGHPCKHAAALCYQTARLLDADPFVLLLLRGRGERELLDALSRRNATRAARAAQEQDPAPLPGVRATEALAARRLPPLPPPLPAPAHPEQPPAYPSAPGGPDAFQLDQLATDAAARAHALLATGHDEIGELTLWQDAVRLAAARPGSGLTAATRSLYASLASAAGRTPADLARAVAAWRQGGPDGLTVLEEPWDPPAGRFDRARPLLLAADLPAFRPWRNHLTHPRGGLQLRFGRDGLWYAYESEPDRDDWWPRGTPDPDPVGALTGLGGGDSEEP
ncbi:SWIM zinc finger family protein [Streptomyces sp. S9]|nr:SWIM zinc finger family protein [Streptomyces sp. S9]